ncbi:cop9 signalosome complex subunit 12 [Phlyctema vagabunda]|uniref:Cop9 signalosome complex subunit 12 n=1 Tax=Phlyctema vagabunda TaxID=108571 RepID=A0ABR4PCR7_9HELO
MAITDEFLTAILGFVRTKNALKLQDWLRVEPPLPEHYYKLAAELQTSFSNSNSLESYIEKRLPENRNARADDGDVWPGFLSFIKSYLEFWRDVNFEDLLQTHAQLTELANACITALSNATYGIVVLPTAIQLSAALAKLAITLDKRPDLTQKLRKVANMDQGGETRKSLVEGTAESIQRAFTMCLTERTSNRNGIGMDGQPEGKKIGIYSFANLVLKLLFQCHKTRLANQLFTNISQNSPPLSLYPASQRVTYLYYLGRFQFSNNHFYHAQRCLQAAYDQCHAQCISQRRMILIHLISSNLILGRFPSRDLVGRPEAQDIIERFLPIAKAIKDGDLVAFKDSLGPTGGNEEWFFKKGVFLPLMYRCEILVWRSLARKVFLLSYEASDDTNPRKAPTMDLSSMAAAAQLCQKVLQDRIKDNGDTTKPKQSKAVMDGTRKVLHILAPVTKRIPLSAHAGVIYGSLVPDTKEIEAVIASLVQQGLMHGFISHSQGKFAILGKKQRGGAIKAGFPNVWEVLKARATRDGKDVDIPGWVQTEIKAPMGGVVNLSGIARPVGSGQ